MRDPEGDSDRWPAGLSRTRRRPRPNRAGECCLSDSRIGKNGWHGWHGVVGLLRQSVYGRLAGYEDVNDADRLGRDPAMRWIVGAKAVERGGASTSQMGRFETELRATEDNLAALAYNLGNFMRTLALPDAVEQWSLTTLREKLVKIGAKIVRAGATSHSKWQRSPCLVTRSPTSCAASTDSDQRQLRHDKRATTGASRRRDGCVRKTARPEILDATTANWIATRWYRHVSRCQTLPSCPPSHCESRSTDRRGSTWGILV
jgi:hypothetical protein